MPINDQFAVVFIRHMRKKQTGKFITNIIFCKTDQTKQELGLSDSIVFGYKAQTLQRHRLIVQ